MVSPLLCSFDYCASEGDDRAGIDVLFPYHLRELFVQEDRGDAGEPRADRLDLSEHLCAGTATHDHVVDRVELSGQFMDPCGKRAGSALWFR